MPKRYLVFTFRASRIPFRKVFNISSVSKQADNDMVNMFTDNNE